MYLEFFEDLVGMKLEEARESGFVLLLFDGVEYDMYADIVRLKHDAALKMIGGQTAVFEDATRRYSRDVLTLPPPERLGAYERKMGLWYPSLVEKLRNKSQSQERARLYAEWLASDSPSESQERALMRLGKILHEDLYTYGFISGDAAELLKSIKTSNLVSLQEAAFFRERDLVLSEAAHHWCWACGLVI